MKDSVKNLFLDVIDNGLNYRFTHLTLLEFFSAIYIAVGKGQIHEGKIKQLSLELIKGRECSEIVKVMMSALCFPEFVEIES